MHWFEIARVVNRSFYIQAVWTYEKMQSVGFTSCLVPFAKRWFDDKDQLGEFLKSNLKFFNTHPYMAGWILGAAIKLEEESRENRRITAEQKVRFRQRVSESLGAIGDQLFWNSMRPLTALLGVLVAFYWGALGAALFLVLYNIPHLYHRFAGVLIGYRDGFDVIQRLSRQKYNRLCGSLIQVSAVCCGIALVLILDSDMTSTFYEKIIFLSGMFATALLLKYRFSIPVILLALMGGSITFGLLVNGL